MKKALITGITGQDGAYLAEFLLNNEIRKALALYHLRAARAPGLSTSARLYQLARCACYSPREFMGKLGEFLHGRLQRR